MKAWIKLPASEFCQILNIAFIENDPFMVNYRCSWRKSASMESQASYNSKYKNNHNMGDTEHLRLMGKATETSPSLLRTPFLSLDQTLVPPTLD